MKSFQQFIEQVVPPKPTNSPVKGDSVNTIVNDNPGKRLGRLMQRVNALKSAGLIK